MEAIGKVPYDLKFNKTVKSRVVSRNESLLNSKQRTNVSEDLVLKHRVIFSEKGSGCRLRANQMGDKGMSNSRCGLVAKWSKNNKPNKMIDTNNDVARAFVASWNLQ